MMDERDPEAQDYHGTILTVLCVVETAKLVVEIAKVFYEAKRDRGIIIKDNSGDAVRVENKHNNTDTHKAEHSETSTPGPSVA